MEEQTHTSSCIQNTQQQKGNTTIMNKASDTDVLVVSVSALIILQDLGVEKLWVAFVQGQKSGFS
jgi:hypothetical protein